MLKLTRERRERTFARQLPDVAAEMARLVESGSTLQVALRDLSDEYPGPAGEELRSVVTDIDSGLLMDQALELWAMRSPLEGLRLLVAACRIGVAEGGNLVAALGGVSAALGDSVELAEETRSMTTQARTSAYVIMVLPLIGVATFTVVDPEVARFLFSTLPGLSIIVAGATLDALGAWCMFGMLRWSLR